MRLLVTGAGGQLGGDLRSVASAAGYEVTGTAHLECDIADAARVAIVLDDLRPDVVINCAAWTKVDAAETAEDAAYRVNVLGPGVLADACAARELLLVHASTDYVFDGTARQPISEDTPPAPRSVYGRTKLEGEGAVRERAPRHIIVRTSWLYGREGPNFIRTMLRIAATGEPPRVVADQVGSPTWTGHLAPAMLRLVERGATGTYHLTNSGSTSWHGLADLVFEAAGLPLRALPISTAEYPTAAARPAYSVLDNRHWRELGEPPLQAWQDGVRSYVEELRLSGLLPAG